MRPQMTAAEIAQVELQLAGRVSLLEFGCGGSTLVAARQVQRIVSVDSDPEWLAKVGENLARAAVDFTPYHADIGPVGEWGYPVDDSRIRDWPRYHMQIWRHLAGSPDAVLIDGASGSPACSSRSSTANPTASSCSTIFRTARITTACCATPIYSRASTRSRCCAPSSRSMARRCSTTCSIII